jgi:4'-phosphopantetheinyl transferase
MRMILTLLRPTVPAPCELWRIDLDQHVPAAALAKLSADEMARARRFVFERDRHRFIAAHAALRQLLGQRSGESGAALRLVAGRFGKPALAAAAGLHFNLSHSQAIGLVALATQREVGVDIELVRPMPDAHALAAAYFTPAEQAALAACAGTGRDRAFFTCWTRKEACLKALGIGLQLATDGFEVGVDPVDRTVEIATPEGTERLHLHSFEDGEQALGAVALRLSHAAVHAATGPSAAPSPELTV